MKLLIFYAPRFESTPFSKTLDDAPESPNSVNTSNAIVVFYHCEEQDAENLKKVETKIVKNIKWVAGKFKSKSVVLHSFSHLSKSKGDPVVAAELIGNVTTRLTNTEYEVAHTPFGWLNEWHLHCAGDSMAKVFVDI